MPSAEYWRLFEKPEQTNSIILSHRVGVLLVFSLEGQPQTKTKTNTVWDNAAI